MTILNKYKSGIPKGAVYIGRGSKWGNPFVMGINGDRNEVCEKYDVFLREQYRLGNVTLEELASLHGRDLVCFCAPARCHGHTLEIAAAWAFTVLTTHIQTEGELWDTMTTVAM